MQTIYRPGAWRLIVRPGLLVALSPDVGDDVVTRLWERTGGEPSLAAVIGGLAQDGGALTSLPSFAAIVVEGEDVRVALRGDVDVTIVAAKTERLSGARVTTWSERLVPRATSIEVVTGPATDGAFLPVDAGVVLASAATATVSAAGAAKESAPSDSVPGHAASTRLSEPVPPAEPASADAPTMGGLGETTVLPTEMTLPPSEEDAEQLWEGTVISAPPPARHGADGIEVEVERAPGGADLGDHDGATISLAELRARREQSSPTGEAVIEGPPAGSANVAATGRIRMSTGQVVDLDRTVIIGRRPRSSRTGGSDLPHLIAVESPQQDISRSHLEVRPEGDTVVVIDLHTTNGSTLLRPGADPVRLHPGEQTLVLSGDVVDLGDGVTVAFEDLP